MKAQVSPVMAVVVIVLVVLGIGFWMWTKSEGKSFTKDEERGGQRMGAGLDVSKMPQPQPGGATK